jgi:hypothetical protein
MAFLETLSTIAGVANAGANVFGALGGGGQDPGAPTGADYSTLYASKLAPGNTRLSIAAQELAAMMGLFSQATNTNTALQASQALGQFNQTAYKDQKLTDLYSGISGGYANSLIGNEDLSAKYKTATEFLGPSTAADLTAKYAETASALQNNVLQGESSALNKVTEGQVLAGINASEQRNKLAGDIASTNLRIREAQESTKNQMALSRQKYEEWKAKHQTGVATALAGARIFA